jgi:hypothetical protein
MRKMAGSFLFCMTMLGAAGATEAHSIFNVNGRTIRSEREVFQIHNMGQWHDGYYWRYYAGELHNVIGQHFFGYYYGKYGFGQPCIKCINNPPEVGR